MVDGCRVCGTEEDMLHTCTECGARLCPVHRLPENHYCRGGESDARWFEEKFENPDEDVSRHSQGEKRKEDSRSGPGQDTAVRDASVGQLPGSTPEFEGSRSPDVAVDGSVRDDTDDGGVDGRNSVRTGKGRPLLTVDRLLLIVAIVVFSGIGFVLFELAR